MIRYREETEEEKSDFEDGKSFVNCSAGWWKIFIFSQDCHCLSADIRSFIEKELSGEVDRNGHEEEEEAKANAANLVPGIQNQLSGRRNSMPVCTQQHCSCVWFQPMGILDSS